MDFADICAMAKSMRPPSRGPDAAYTQTARELDRLAEMAEKPSPLHTGVIGDVMGIPVFLDEGMPPDCLEFRRDGEVLARVDLYDADA